MTEFPVPKDPHTVAIEKGIEEAAATARHYLDKLLGAGLEQGGGLIADTVGFWRFKNTVNIILKAKAFLESKGVVEPQRVPPKIAAAILDAGSLETEDTMQQRWAALLASAATPHVGDFVLPGYPSILSQLTPTHVGILDWLYDHTRHPSVTDPGVETWDSVAAANVFHRFGLNTADYEIIATDLHRLQLIDGRRAVSVSPNMGAGMSGSLYGSSVARQTTAASYEEIGLTPLGVAFIKCCRVPT